MTKSKYGQVVNLEQYLQDGCLTEPSDGNRYAWRDMIEQIKLLGRQLSSKELKCFEVK